MGINKLCILFVLNNIKTLDHNTFILINSKLKCKLLDFCFTLQSIFDSKKFNLGFIIILILLSIFILWKNNKKTSIITIIVFISTLFISSITVYVLKNIFRRERPAMVFNDKNINILFEKRYKNSFPSGHSQIAFTICFFMFKTIKKYKKWYIMLALFICLERIYTGNHFPSDVIVGALIGTFLSYITIKITKKYIYQIS